mmetsp:Transcript_149206/g.212076  ORF Transcript_149206/g.212076 Transcript_149206/m.212076 type:complete len:215 (+) Transcript_149206:217-861(+)
MCVDPVVVFPLHEPTFLSVVVLLGGVQILDVLVHVPPVSGLVSPKEPTSQQHFLELLRLQTQIRRPIVNHHYLPFGVRVTELHRVRLRVPVAELPIEVVGASDQILVLALNRFSEVALLVNDLAHALPGRQPLVPYENLADVVAGPGELPEVFPLVPRVALHRLHELLLGDVGYRLEALGLGQLDDELLSAVRCRSCPPSDCGKLGIPVRLEEA